MANEKPISLKTKEYRKVVKPLLERRRRARINGCLNELRNFILEATKQENSQASKLEKADILEMTVHYLKLLLRQQCVASSRANVMELGRFRAGYTECANEVSACVSVMSNVNPQVRSRLLTHLSKCLNQLDSMNVTVSSNNNTNNNSSNGDSVGHGPPTPSPSHLSPLMTPNTHFPHFICDPEQPQQQPQQQQQCWAPNSDPLMRRPSVLTHGPNMTSHTDWSSVNVTPPTSASSSIVWRPW